MTPAANDRIPVLVADDDAATRMLLKRTLEADGYAVAVAGDGVAALAAFEAISRTSGCPRLILLDGLMPGKDGFDTCRALRALPQGKEIGILLVTGLNDEVSARRAFDAGASDYVTKPFHWPVLLNRMRRLLAEMAHEQQVARLQTEDPLTGLPNRQAFLDHVTRALDACREESGGEAAGSGCYIMQIDIEKLGRVNDLLGEQAGDLLLRIAAERLSGLLAAGEVLARGPSDEFYGLRSATMDPESSARALLAAFELPFSIHGQSLHVRARIGAAMAPNDGNVAQVLLRAAESALARACQSESDFALYLPSWQAEAARHLSLEGELHLALERGEFEVYYQPIIRLTDGCVHGMEALIRWHHPERGLVPPLDFIPVAESSGLIIPIGRWVLDEACRFVAGLRAAGYPLTVSVNLSLRQFRDPELLALVSRALHQHGLPPQALDLEVTESLALNDVEEGIRLLQDLKRHGVVLSLDDFGTGYSSLSMLHRMPFDILKIDRAFVQPIGAEARSCSLACGIVALAQSLEMAVIAEGIETEMQRAVLADGGCAFGQGYLFSKPVPGPEFTRFVARQAEQNQQGQQRRA